MKVLLDHDLSAQLRLLLKGHLVLTARAMRWDALSNGRLLAAAEANRFDVLLTGDQGLVHQQNKANRTIALVVLSGTELRTVLANCKLVLDAIERSTPDSFEFVRLPRNLAYPDGRIAFSTSWLTKYSPANTAPSASPT